MPTLKFEPDAPFGGQDVHAQVPYIEVFGEAPDLVLSIDLSLEAAHARRAAHFRDDLPIGIWEREPDGDYRWIGWLPPR